MVVCFVDAAFKPATSSITDPTILDAGYIHDSTKTSSYLSSFLTRDVNKAFAEVTGEKVNRRAGYGLQIPCVYRLYGPKAYVDRMKEITDSIHDVFWTYHRVGRLYIKQVSLCPKPTSLLRPLLVIPRVVALGRFHCTLPI